MRSGPLRLFNTDLASYVCRKMFFQKQNFASQTTKIAYLDFDSKPKQNIHLRIQNHNTSIILDNSHKQCQRTLIFKPTIPWNFLVD